MHLRFLDSYLLWNTGRSLNLKVIFALDTCQITSIPLKMVLVPSMYLCSIHTPRCLNGFVLLRFRAMQRHEIPVTHDYENPHTRLRYQAASNKDSTAR